MANEKIVEVSAENARNDSTPNTQARWGRVYFPENALIKKSVSDKGASLIMPDDSKYKGYTVFIPKSLYNKKENDKGTFYSVSCPPNFIFRIQNRAGDNRELTSAEFIEIKKEIQKKYQEKQAVEIDAAVDEKIENKDKANGAEQNKNRPNPMVELNTPLRVWSESEKGGARVQIEKDGKIVSEWLPLSACKTTTAEDGVKFITAVRDNIVKQKSLPIKASGQVMQLVR